MVTAGVYLVVRSNAIFALSPAASLVVAAVGAGTALFAASIGLRQNDIKKVLAFSTVSQLGLMFLAVGSGAYVAGIFHLVTHAFFKAVLFLGAGSVIHTMHHAYHSTHNHADPQDMRNMGGLRTWMPWTSTLMWIATLAIAGIPVFAGFFSKDEILVAVFGRAAGQGVFYALWLVASIASLLTAVYMGRLMMMTFHGPNRTGTAEQSQLHEAPWVMTLPLAVLGLLSVGGGLINLPHFAGGHLWLEHWLEPVLAPSHDLVPLVLPEGYLEASLVGLAALLGIVGLVIGTRAVLRRPAVTPAEAAPETGFARVLSGQYFVDALYDRFIVRPVQWFARSVLWKTIDQWLVDGIAVTGSARLLQGFGWLGSRFENGQLGLYLLVFVAGAVWVLGVVLR
jgi:NADH-quinone oxidoreductase subunit L